ncbi:hypothetical protein G9A89_006556 [Geosiphon pyriformis]|nr:hypothetical protein G9A89_006556 [Geosiphon pyriformis]
MDVQHRSFHLESVRKLTNFILANPTLGNASPKGSNKPPPLQQLWSLLTSRGGIISSSVACSIVSLVQAGALSWTDAIYGFIDALGAAQGMILESVVVGIASVLCFPLEAQSQYTCPFKANAGLGGKTHPFILVITIKPEAWKTLLSQLDLILDPIRAGGLSTGPVTALYLSNALDMLIPFLDFVLLGHLQDSDLASMIIQLLLQSIQNLVDEMHVNFKQKMLQYLLQVFQKISPSPKEPHRPYFLMQSLVNVLLISIRRNSLSPSFLVEFSSSLALQLLSHLCDAHSKTVPIIPYVRLLRQILELQKELPAIFSELNFILLWPSLSYLLLDTNSIESQIIILDLMKNSINKLLKISDEGTPLLIIDFGILPLFQVVSDVAQGSTRNCAMEVFLSIEKIRKRRKWDLGNFHPKVQKKITALLSHPSINGTLATILGETSRFLEIFSQASIRNSNLGFNSLFSTLFVIPYLFYPDPIIRIHSLTTITTMIQENLAETQKIPILLIVLYLLRNDPATSVHLHILHYCLPSLISPTDSTITAKILKVTMTMIKRNDNQFNMRLGGVGVRVLYGLWEKQKRCWKSLRYVLSEWVQQRKLNSGKTLDTESESYEMEVAVLATIRDICRTKAHDYAEELIPFVSSLLQSVCLRPASLCLIIEALNACVSSDVIDPRAVWNVLLVYIANAIMQEDPLNTDLTARICHFYQIAALKSNDLHRSPSYLETDVYIAFKQEILSTYLRPLIFPFYQANSIAQAEDLLFQITPNSCVLKHALNALSHFPAPDILSIFPESPKILLSQILNGTSSVEEWKPIFSKLVSNEIDHMQRGLFKGIISNKSTPNISTIGSNTKQVKIRTFKKQLSLICSKILDDWESGMVSPGLRVGFALTSLISYRLLEPSENSSPDLKATQFYRLMNNAIDDISLSDHWLIRVGAVTYWWKFFENGLQEVFLSGKNEDVIVQGLVDDLLDKLVKAKFPIVFQNLILSLTGLCLALKSLNITSTQTQAARLLQYLLDNYIFSEFADLQNQQLEHDWSFISNDEVQFACMLALGYLVSLTSMDEKLICEVIDILIGKLAGSTTRISSEWRFFAASYTLGILLACLSSSPTKTITLSNICSQTISYLEDLLTNNDLDFNTTLGIMLGLANIDREQEQRVERVYQTSLTTVKRFIDTAGIIETNKGIVVGAVWFISFSSGKKLSEEIVEILGKAMQIAEKSVEWKQYHFHFAQAYFHALQAILEFAPSSHNLSSFNGQVHFHLQVLSSPSSNSSTRCHSIITLGTLAGVDFISLPRNNSNDSYFFKSSSDKIIFEVLNTLRHFTGLNEQSLAINDPKAGRLAAVVLGRFLVNIELLDQDDEEFELKFSTTSTEPKDYSRFSTSSYLRALFDGLNYMSTRAMSESPISIETVGLILSAFTAVNFALPPINWFIVLSRFNELPFKKFNLHHQCILMASKHCSQSTSLLEFLVHKLISFSEIQSDDELKKLLLERGLAKILKISGFGKMDINQEDKTTEKKGMNISKTLIVPNSRVVEIVKGIVGNLFKETASKQTQDLQLTFLSTMTEHLSAHKDEIPSVGALNGLYNDLASVLKIAYDQLGGPSNAIEEQIIRLAVQCAFFRIEDLNYFGSANNFSELQKYALAVCTLYELERVDSPNNLTQLLQDCLGTFVSTSNLDDSQTVMIFSWIGRAIRSTIINSSKTGIDKRLKLAWLVRILDVLIVGSGSRNNSNQNLEYEVVVSLSGILNNTWKNKVAQRDWDVENFLQMVQNIVSVRQLTATLPEEVDFEQADDEMKGLQQQVKTVQFI